MKWENGMIVLIEGEAEVNMVAEVFENSLRSVNLNTGLERIVVNSNVTPFCIQIGDELKLTRDNKYFVTCRIETFSYDMRGNFKIHSKDLTYLTKYSSAYWEDVERWLTGIVNT